MMALSKEGVPYAWYDQKEGWRLGYDDRIGLGVKYVENIPWLVPIPEFNELGRLKKIHFFKDYDGKSSIGIEIATYDRFEDRRNYGIIWNWNNMGPSNELTKDKIRAFDHIVDKISYSPQLADGAEVLRNTLKSMLRELPLPLPSENDLGMQDYLPVKSIPLTLDSLLDMYSFVRTIEPIEGRTNYGISGGKILIVRDYFYKPNIDERSVLLFAWTSKEAASIWGLRFLRTRDDHNKWEKPGENFSTIFGASIYNALKGRYGFISDNEINFQLNRVKTQDSPPSLPPK